jgi:vacuolar protein sorting-associated protein 72
MAADDHDDDPPAGTDADADSSDSTSPSASGSGSDSGSDSESQDEPVEWLVTSRAKRATAGNRLTSILQQEEAEDELELLFAEADDDAGFEDDEADSDVQMDSSSDEEDQGPAAGADDLEGEQELRRVERQAKKRKVNDGIPKIFKKKLRIDPVRGRMPAPAPRPKKKSERASWIPTAEDAPTRASARGTTRQSKEQLHVQMIDREVKRLRQLANMEKAAAAKEAAKKPALTQADRLAEAARIEKSNAKSLSRWEEAEIQREEEQRAKLAALSNRQLEGPVVTWWSGMGEWTGGVLKHVGKNLTLEDPKEKQTKKRKAAEMEADSAATVAVPDQAVPKNSEASSEAPTNPAASDALVKAPTDASPQEPEPKPEPKSEPKSEPASEPTPELAPEPASATPAQVTDIPTEQHPDPSPQPTPQPTAAAAAPAPPHPPFILAPPLSLQPPPPPPVLDGSMPLPGLGFTPNIPQGPPPAPPHHTPYPPPPDVPPAPPAIEHAGLNYLILSNFDEDAIKSKDVQTQVLFNRKFHKAPRTLPLPHLSHARR